MATTATKTQTIASTYTHIYLLKAQVAHILKRADNTSDDGLADIFSLLDQKLIDYVAVYAEDSQGKCCSSLEMEINWAEFDRSVTQSATVKIEGWSGEIIPDVAAMLNAFMSDVQLRSLKVHNRIRFVPSVLQDQARHKQLCSQYHRLWGAPPVAWKGKSDAYSVTPPEQPSAKYTTRVAS